MNRKFYRLANGVLLFLYLSVPAAAARLLIPVGRIVGLELHNNTVTVVSFEDASPAKAAGVKEGDRLLRIDRQNITCAQDVRTALDQSHGTVTLTLQRGDDLTTLKVAPTITAQGPKLGLTCARASPASAPSPITIQPPTPSALWATESTPPAGSCSGSPRVWPIPPRFPMCARVPPESPAS